MSHRAQAFVLCCIDFRFRTAVNAFVERTLNLQDWDIKTEVGGVKELLVKGPGQEAIIKSAEMSFRGHSVNRVILINHQDCGGYGGSQAFASPEAEFQFHSEELRKAAAWVK